MLEWIEFDEDLEKLKNHFKGEINSNRRFEQITTVEELVSVLEDRDALTHDVLLKCDEKFVNFVKSSRENSSDLKKLTIPEHVVSLINKELDNWEVLGEYLKLTDEQLKKCHNAEDVLTCYVENCEGISQKEVMFRVNLGLEKCRRINLKKTIVEMLKEN